MRQQDDRKSMYRSSAVPLPKTITNSAETLFNNEYNRQKCISHDVCECICDKLVKPRLLLYFLAFEKEL